MVPRRAAGLPPLVLLFMSGFAVAGEDGARAEYVGGTVAALAGKVKGRIVTTGPGALVFTAKAATVQVPYESVNLIEYGQNASRRYALGILISPVLLLSKSRKHYLTIGYTDREGRQQAMVFRVDKKDLRAVLASLEARTGRKVEYQDEEARKAGRGS